MKKIKVIVNGLPGRLAVTVARAILASEDIELIPVSLSGENSMYEFVLSGRASKHELVSVKLMHPEEISNLTGEDIPDVIIDLLYPPRILEDVNYYCTIKVPFIIETIGLERFINEKTKNVGVEAVVLPEIIGVEQVLKAVRYLVKKNKIGTFKEECLLLDLL